MALTQAQIAIVKSTAPVLRQHGQTITTTFYKSMLAAHPSLRNTFSLRNQQTGAQQRALANAVLAYATHIDDLPKLHSAVERIAHKHASLFITPDQYSIVGTHLMGAIAEVLGPALTTEIHDAWVAAYGQLAGVFIKREEELYAASKGPATWRKFTIVNKVAESESVTTFYLEPSDNNAPLDSYLPGQYVSLQVPLPHLDGLLQSRQYSLSEYVPLTGATSAPKRYKITVKREHTIPNAPLADVGEGRVPGVVSNLLHDSYNVGDEVELSHPQGDFFIDVSDVSKANVPVVLLSAGVGATPLFAILEAILSPESQVRGRPVRWVQAARHSGARPFAHTVDKIISAGGPDSAVRSKVFLDELRKDDVAGQDYDFEGQLDLSKLDRDADLFLGREDAEYLVCGPVEWMIAVRRGLQDLGVSKEQIRLELFGTGDVEE